jgi:hypothetical protein
MPFDPEAILRVLDKHGVLSVVVGGVAAVIHGSPTTTLDIDLVPKPDRANLDRLSDALRELGARIRAEGAPDGLPFNHDGASLASAEIWNLVTRFGEVDLLFHPAGFDGFADLASNAETVDFDGIPVLVAALDDVIRSKEAAGRAKDIATLPYLRRLRATILQARQTAGDEPE